MMLVTFQFWFVMLTIYAFFDLKDNVATIYYYNKIHSMELPTNNPVADRMTIYNLTKIVYDDQESTPYHWVFGRNKQSIDLRQFQNLNETAII